MNEMIPWCHRCDKQTGEKFKIHNQEELNGYHHIINRTFYKK